MTFEPHTISQAIKSFRREQPNTICTNQRFDPGYCPGNDVGHACSDVQLIPVVEWLNPFLSLSLAELCGIRELEKSRGKLHQPAGVNGSCLSHVLFSGEHQLMVDYPEEGMAKNTAYTLSTFERTTPSE